MKETKRILSRFSKSEKILHVSKNNAINKIKITKKIKFTENNFNLTKKNSNPI